MRWPAAAALAAALALAACPPGAHAARGPLRVQTPRARGNSSSGIVIRKPLTDGRVYEYTTFENGLKVLAVQDPKAAKAGFAVAVQAGSFYDPPALPGLAHFCEHLLFLGTKKYPDEASFDNFMSQHDGTNNAYTSQERTVFENEVGHAGFEEGLDRFAQFFIEPLFKGDMVGRELNAVNSEHEKNKPDQGRRLWQVLRGTAGEGSVLGRFYTGTTESLHHGDASTVEALKKYHDANYCATRMSLVVVSNLTTAKQLAASRRHFGAVPRGKCSTPRDFGQDGPAFEAGRLKQFIRMGTESTPALWMMFPVAPTLKLYREAPMQYLQYVLGYAGPHSLRSRLKKRGLITDLGIQVDESTAATLLFVMFTLTPEGTKEESIREIGDTTFAYLRLLKQERAGEVPAVYESLQRMSKVDFDYSEAPDSVMDAVSQLADAMSSYAPEDVLTASQGVVDEVNPERVRALLANLAEPGNMNLALAVPGFNASLANRHEQYYGIAFHQEPVPQSWMSSWVSAVSGGELRVPPALRYVPSTLVVGNASAGPVPQKQLVRAKGAENGTRLELWWKGRGAFALPKAQLRLHLGMRAGNASAHLVALQQLHAELARQVLEEAAEDLRNCGLDFEVQPSSRGYQLQASGYSQYAGALLLQALDGLLRPEFGPEEFARAHRQVVDGLADTTRRMPYELAVEELSALTVDTAFGRAEVLTALRRLDEAALRAHLAAQRGEGLRARLLVVGDVERASASRLAEEVAGRVESLAGGLLPERSWQRPRVVVASKPMELRMQNPIPGDMNHATVNSYQYGVADIADRVRLLLLGKMIADPVYDALRTKKQLGYVVFGFVAEQVNVLELRVLVQGDKETPDVVDNDIEGVLDDFGSKLASMSRDEFSTWKSSLRSALNHKDQNMGQETDRYWSQILNDGHCFNRKELALRYLETLDSVDAALKAFQEIRKGHRKVSVKMFGGGVDLHASQLQTSNSSAEGAPPSISLVSAGGVDAAEKEHLARNSGFYPSQELCRVSES